MEVESIETEEFCLVSLKELVQVIKLADKIRNRIFNRSLITFNFLITFKVRNLKIIYC